MTKFQTAKLSNFPSLVTDKSVMHRPGYRPPEEAMSDGYLGYGLLEYSKDCDGIISPIESLSARIPPCMVLGVLFCGAISVESVGDGASFEPYDIGD